ncbi:MAG: MaoC/PaaZ C-terminal domain-containing protein [Steroidobacteraceae bacterium]|nr:MaoC/PaaZ C-terminal domain-containing protein [Steroidobacteraceae bacterium]MDW8259228.1 MaoC/PaaZ C-terminal domain-containing protein [Gammaproteobacteria bacterium]
MLKRRRYFEDLQLGERAESRALRVELDEMLEFARRYDPQFFHADPVAARQSRFGAVIASGIYTAALWRRLDHEISADIAWICGIAWRDVRWPTALRSGDLVRAQFEVLAKRPSRSDPTRGIVEARYRLVNQHDAPVFECVSVNLVERAPSAADAAATSRR